MNIAFKETKQVVTLKNLELEKINDFINSKIRAPVTKIKHPTISGVYLLYHERKPSDPKDENFYFRNFCSDGRIKNKIIYGDAIFVKENEDGKLENMNEKEYEKLLKSFKNFTIVKEYINAGGGNLWQFQNG